MFQDKSRHTSVFCNEESSFDKIHKYKLILMKNVFKGRLAVTAELQYYKSCPVVVDASNLMYLHGVTYMIASMHMSFVFY